MTDALPIAPTDWHKRPPRTKGPCPVCGIPDKYLGDHRRIEDPSALRPRWLKRYKSPDGWRYVTVETRPKLPRPPRPQRSDGPSEAVKARITEVLRQRIFAGKPIEQIATTIEVTSQTIYKWRRRYRSAWAAIEQELAGELVEWVRRSAGTDAVKDDVDLFLARAITAEKWSKATATPLFPADQEPTLSSFYRDYYFPLYLRLAGQKSTWDYYETRLRRWRLITGDPPLSSITAELLAQFRDTLANSRGSHPCKRMSPNSVISHLATIQAILVKAGPPGPRCRDAAGLLDRVPWVRPPRAEMREPQIVPVERINQVYVASLGMDFPKVGEVKPPKWWRGLIVTVLNTGLRRRTIFRLRWDWVDWQNRLIKIPAESMKSRKVHVVPLNETVLRHLHAIRNDRDLIFPWPLHPRMFDKYLHALLDLAGIPKNEHFGLHALRKTLATMLWQTSPQAAQLALGHSSQSVTVAHYIEQTGIVAAAIAALPQPAAFGASAAGTEEALHEPAGCTLRQ